MKKLYICCTYYHLLISVIKSLQSNEKCDVLLTTSWNDFKLISDKKLIEKLNKSKIFENVFIDDGILNQLKQSKKGSFKELKKYILLKKYIRNFHINLLEYNDIYVFNYNNPSGRMINKCKIYHNLLEDGTDCFKNNKNIIEGRLSLKKIIKKYILHMDQLGESKYAKSVEVNDLTDVNISNKNIIELSKKDMFDNLSDSEKKNIVSLFINNSNWLKLNNATLIITQPFFADAIVKTKEEQLEIYKDIIDKYGFNDKIIIKPHPRDDINYEKIIPKSNIIEEIFPIEILNFTNVKFNKVITVSSTSVNLIYNCNEKIFLGWDWLEEWVKKYER